jgi:hypothetical protein
MRKTFSLNVEGKNRDRTVEAVKHEIRKYIKRERRRELPAGVDYWDFDCKFGADKEAAVPVHLAQITGLIDGVVTEGRDAFYVEVIARHGHRKAGPGMGAAEPAANDE